MQVPFLWHFATFEQASKCCLTQICGETYQEAGHLSGNGDDFICPAIDGSDGRPNLISIYQYEQFAKNNMVNLRCFWYLNR